MEQSIFNSRYSWLLLLVLILISFSGSVDAYKNYTVGDSLGWFDKLEKPKINYDKWVADKKFSLGDFLSKFSSSNHFLGAYACTCYKAAISSFSVIGRAELKTKVFNTDNNHSVIQTYNFTTYKSCDYDNALDNDTVQWSSADSSSTSTFPVSMAVPLRKVGTTYFFSSDYDGEQCQNGQHFKINVMYGQGLPRSLRDPSDDDSLAPISPISGDEESAPDTLVPSSFDHPRDVSTDDSPEPSNSISLSIFSQCLGIQLNWISVVFALAFGIC
ncbi:putative proteasome-associated protein ECM29 -like protein [Capsicum annuum]|nr:putative proteasome-associated protein ECM29 -like protein [Capsicum annuum]KAF3651963.1 putative proteasome-associated protein ECM29 -like protein [Capsicum annuum]